MSTTYLFPDSSLPEKTNGGFETQEALKQFVLERQGNGRWNGTLHARPLAERLIDYHGDSIAKAFPLQFPYGHSGLEEDPAVRRMAEIFKGHKTRMKREKLTVLRKFLQNSKPSFHSAQFNLIVENLILKEEIFQSARIFCNVKNADGSRMSEKYGNMSANAFINAIKAARQNHGSQYSTKTENRYLRSILASCKSLPHSNEAADEARRKFFSFLIVFGFPALFLTITPDDKRNFRIVLYSLKDKIYSGADIDINELDDEDILLEFKIREKVREDYPGLCAEEYDRIIKEVIKHLFNWDEEKQCSTGKGIFGELIAWCLATEEQGRKTLHGHFLLFVKGWDETNQILQTKNGSKSFQAANKNVKQFIDNCCSSRLFSNFGPHQQLSQQPVFFHENCRPIRSTNNRRFTADYAGDQIFRDMRHHKKCMLLKGTIGKCNLCNFEFNANDIVELALQYHFGKNIPLQKQNINQRPTKRQRTNEIIRRFDFPNIENKRLDRLVYELQKDFDWNSMSDNYKAKRYFANNAISNFHLPSHTKRCFKKSNECFACLPERPFDKTTILFDDEMHIWSDWSGLPISRGIFKFYPRRNLEDAFINCHNELITTVLGFNNNVTAGLSGSSVFYCTGYAAKPQQKEEREAFEKISKVIMNILDEQKKDNEKTPTQLGFRAMLAGIYVHSNSYILAAPMAHYLALNNSRFRYSHKLESIPLIGLEHLILKENTIMSFRNNEDGQQVPFHRAMDYLYRPTEFEEMSPTEYFCQTESISLKEAEKYELEVFYFQIDHPMRGLLGRRRRKKNIVPEIPWNFIPNINQITLNNDPDPYEQRILFKKPSQAGTSDFEKREKHARKFLIVFSSYRTIEDLNKEHSFQATLREQLKEGRLSEEMIDLANHMQNIHNSLDSGQCQNILNLNTCPPDSDEITENNAGPKDSFEEMLTTVAEYMASTEGYNPKQEEEIDLTPNFGLDCTTNTTSSKANTEKCLDDVFDISENKNTRKEKKGRDADNIERFQSKVSELNSFLVTRFCTVNENFETEHTNQAEDEELISNNEKKYNIHPTGSWQSIVAWGKNAELDNEQEIAFQILASSYVLTFLEEAEQDITGKQKEFFDIQKKALQKLARRKENFRGPLRLFVTGPAGAGKCKFHSVIHSVCLSSTNKLT